MKTNSKTLKFLVLECSDLMICPSPIRPFKALYSSGTSLYNIFLKYDEIFCNTVMSYIGNNSRDIVLDNFVNKEDFIMRQIFIKKKNGVVLDFTLKLSLQEITYICI